MKRCKRISYILSGKQEEEIRKTWNKAYPSLWGHHAYFCNKGQWANELTLPDNCPLSDNIRHFRLAYIFSKGWNKV